MSINGNPNYPAAALSAQVLVAEGRIAACRVVSSCTGWRRINLSFAVEWLATYVAPLTVGLLMGPRNVRHTGG